MLLVLPEKPIGMQPQSIAIKAQQAIDLMFGSSRVPALRVADSCRHDKRTYGGHRSARGRT